MKREYGFYWVRTKANSNEWNIGCYNPILRDGMAYFPWIINGGYYDEKGLSEVKESRILNPDEK